MQERVIISTIFFTLEIDHIFLGNQFGTYIESGLSLTHTKKVNAIFPYCTISAVLYQLVHSVFLFSKGLSLFPFPIQETFFLDLTTFLPLINLSAISHVITSCNMKVQNHSLLFHFFSRQQPYCCSVWEANGLILKGIENLFDLMYTLEFAALRSFGEKEENAHHQ